MKLLFLIFISTLSILANPLELAPGKITNTINNQITVEDKEHSLTKEDILRGDFSDASNISKHSYSKSAFWTRSTLKNRGDKKIDFILRNLRAGTDFIDVYIYKNNKLIDKHLLGDQRVQKDRRLLSTKSAFYLSLGANEEVVLISRYESFGSMDLFWQMMPVDIYTQINGIENIFYGIFGGVIIALIIYNFMVFFTLKERVFIYYVLHGLSVWIFTYATNGVFYFLNTGISLKILTLLTWVAPVLTIIFLLLFTIEFFSLRKNSKTFFYLSFGIITISFLALIAFIYGYLYDRDTLNFVTPIYIQISFSTYLMIFCIALWGVYKKIDGAIYFLVGESIYVMSMAYMLFIFAGGMNIAYYTYFAIPTAVVLEMIFFALAIGEKIKRIKNELEEQKILSLQESYFEKYSGIVSNIAHQWKQPLSSLSARAMFLQTLAGMNRNDVIKRELLDTVPKINDTLQTMSNTIDFYHNFYQNSSKKVLVALKKEIETMVQIYEYRLISNHIDVKIDIPKELEVMVVRSALVQIFIILFDNSIEQFEQKNSKENTISISVSNENEELNILYEDNAGGFDIDAQKVFEAKVTTKQKDGGMGLFLLKTIVTTTLSGSVKAKSSDNKAIFTIKFPL